MKLLWQLEIQRKSEIFMLEYQFDEMNRKYEQIQMNVDPTPVLEQDQQDNKKRAKEKKSLSTTKDTVSYSYTEVTIAREAML